MRVAGAEARAERPPGARGLQGWALAMCRPGVSSLSRPATAGGLQVLHVHEWGGAFVSAITMSHFRQLQPGFRVVVEPHGGHVWCGPCTGVCTGVCPACSALPPGISAAGLCRREGHRPSSAPLPTSCGQGAAYGQLADRWVMPDPLQARTLSLHAQPCARACTRTCRSTGEGGAGGAALAAHRPPSDTGPGAGCLGGTMRGARLGCDAS